MTLVRRNEGGIAVNGTLSQRESESKYKMVRLILRSVAINRNNIREVSLCKWFLCLPEMYPVAICIFAVAEISKDFSG